MKLKKYIISHKSRSY